MLTALFSLFTVAAAAQAVTDPQREAQQPKAAVEAQESARRSAAEARKQRQVEGEDVTYEQVLANPDDKALNLRYARVQVRRGDVKSASATLERLLLVDPKQPQVHLFYGLVLLRLGNLGEAKREVEIALKQGLAPAQQAEAAEYLKDIEGRMRRNRLSGRLAVGAEWASNRNSAPIAENRLAFGAPITIDNPSRRRADAALVTSAAIDARRDLGFQAGHEAFVGLTYYRSDQGTLKKSNLQAHSATGGLALKLGRVELTPAGVFDHVMLGNFTLLRDRGASLRASMKVHPGVDAYVDGRWIYDEYQNNAAIRTATERNGPQWEAAVGLSGRVAPRLRLGAAFVRGDKFAVRRYNAYSRVGLRGDAVFLPGKGTFVQGAVAFNEDIYQAPDAAVSARGRRDQTWRFGMTAGAPLGGLHRWLRDATWTVSYEHFRSDSNLVNYEYFNNKISTMLAYRWEAGF